MLFTDGGEERAQAILEKYNADKKVYKRHTYTRFYHYRGQLTCINSLLSQTNSAIL